METINDVLYYLNKLAFTDEINETDFENLRCVKRKFWLKNLKNIIYLN